jgi:DNA-binding response OmpR family regulator
MYENPERVVTRDQIVEGVWPDSEGEGVSEQAIDALVRRLRERLSEIDPEQSYILTVRGHGFRLNNPM